MLLKIKNKDTLIIDDFSFRCCVGRNGIKKISEKVMVVPQKGLLK